jgi:hypothetical protein
MTKDEICGLLRQIHDVLAMQSETNQVKLASDYERGVIDGMLKQAESSVDRAVNAMAKRTWVGLANEEIDVIYEQHHNQYDECISVSWGYERAIEAKLKEKNYE